MNHQELLHKFADRSITPAEREAFWQSLDGMSWEEQVALVEQHDHIMTANPHWQPAQDTVPEHLLLRMRTWETPAPNWVVRRLPFLQTTWLRYAAIVLLLVGTAAYFFYNNALESSIAPAVASEIEKDIAPGKEGTVLTLADGSQVVLDSLGDGLVAAQNGAEVVLKNGRIAYSDSGGLTAAIAYNTLSTPKGRQFPITLPDGTQVWLNAASSIRYPTVFRGKERSVTITGEVYFEVAKNASMPFRVNINNRASVDVLGTAFNVNAYDNETSIYTTLMEGSIAVAIPSGNPIRLQPGQQAVMMLGKQRPAAISIEKDVNIEKVIAWKNGLFNFDGLTLGEIMRQVERWYDIQILYEKNVVPNKRLAGEMSRDVPLQGLLKNLEKLGLRYRIEGRVVIVMP